MTVHRIGLPPQLRALYIERIPATLGALCASYIAEPMRFGISVDTEWNEETQRWELRAPLHVAGNGYWRLPIHVGHNPNLGTFLYLYDDGKIERWTIREDEGDEVALIKPSDKDIP